MEIKNSNIEINVPMVAHPQYSSYWYAKEVADKIIKLSGVNIYANSRVNDVIEHRALVCYLLKEKLKLKLHEISSFFKSQGKLMHYTTVIHNAKMYPIYKAHNKQLSDFEKTFVFKSKVPYDEMDKINYLQNIYIDLENKYLKLEEKLKHPLVKLITSIPEDKMSEVKESIQLMKSSWKWK